MCFFSVCFSEGVIFIVSGVSGLSVEGLVEGSRGFLGFRIFILIIFFIKILLCERLRRWIWYLYIIFWLEGKNILWGNLNLW